MTRVKVSKIGGSHYVRLPISLLETLEIKDGDVLSLTLAVDKGTKKIAIVLRQVDK